MPCYRWEWSAHALLLVGMERPCPATGENGAPMPPGLADLDTTRILETEIFVDLAKVSESIGGERTQLR